MTTKPTQPHIPLNCSKPPECIMLVSLKEFIEVRLDASQHALELARELMEVRLEGLNHLRNQVLTKAEYDSAHHALAVKHDSDVKMIQASISDLREWKAEQKGKASQTSVYLAYCISILGLIISLVTLWHEVIK